MVAGEEALFVIAVNSLPGSRILNIANYFVGQVRHADLQIV
jgi:hypothetical protein